LLAAEGDRAKPGLFGDDPKLCIAEILSDLRFEDVPEIKASSTPE
jgi:hypothetical protein